MAFFRARAGMATGALAAGLVLAASAGAWAQAARDTNEREKPPHGYDWRPAPPAVHGFWGQRRWQRYSEDFGTRTVPASSYGDGRR